MKVKHIFTTCGIILGGFLAAQGASAVITYQDHSDVQFTFGSVLSLDVDSDFVIDDLVPGTSENSNEVTATVTTNSSAGYTLSATVGGTSPTSGDVYSTSALVSSNSTIPMIAANGPLTAGSWGYIIYNGSSYGTNYGRLDTSDSTPLNKTTDVAGTAATGYVGSDETKMKIGAYAAASQKPGAYSNVINFIATANANIFTVTLQKNDANVSTVDISISGVSQGTSGPFLHGQILDIAATCVSGKTFAGWNISGDYGRIANRDSATTTYAVGPNDVTITAYCY